MLSSSFRAATLGPDETYCGARKGVYGQYKAARMQRARLLKNN